MHEATLSGEKNTRGRSESCPYVSELAVVSQQDRVSCRYVIALRVSGLSFLRLGSGEGKRN